MESTFFAIFWPVLTAFLGSLLTFVSGFGLGTILLPVFAMFFPLPEAIAMTGLVHLLNNFFKLGLVRKIADWEIVKKFGIPSVFGGILGAFLLNFLGKLPEIASWTSGEKTFSITPVKLAVGFLLLFFCFWELLPGLKNRHFSAKLLVFGGFASGFFGGLSGMQGALRSAFLKNSGLSKEAFVATGVVVACLVDLTRLPIYFSGFLKNNLENRLELLFFATISAFAGAILGKYFLQKMTLRGVRIFTTGMILVIAFLLIFGII